MKSQQKFNLGRSIVIPDEYQDSECPGDETMLRFIEGIAPEDEKNEVIAHAVHCMSCRQTIAIGSRFIAEFEHPEKKARKKYPFLLTFAAAAFIIILLVIQQNETPRGITILKAIAQTDVQRPYEQNFLYPSFGNLRSPEKNAFLKGIDSVYHDIEYIRSNKLGDNLNNLSPADELAYFYLLGRFVEISYLSLTQNISDDVDRKKLAYLIEKEGFTLLPKGVTKSLITISESYQSDILLLEVKNIRSILMIKQ